jgi:hypothetical protein
MKVPTRGPLAEVAATTAATIAPPALVVPPVLVDGAGAARVLVNEGAPASFTPGGPSVGVFPEQTDYALVAERSEAVQVLDDSGPARVLLWIARRHLSRVTTRTVALAPESIVEVPSVAARRSELGAGAPVEVVARAGDLARVRCRHFDVELYGWIPASVIGDVYVPAINDVPSLLEDRIELGPTAVRTEPRKDATIVARLTSDHNLGSILGRRRGWYEIVLETTEGPVDAAETVVRGFVPRSARWRPPRGRHSDDVDGGVSCRHEDTVTEVPIFVAKGTCLRARPGGEVVGILSENRTSAPTADAAGWWRMPVSTSVGNVDVYLEARDLAHDARARAERRVPAFASCDRAEEPPPLYARMATFRPCH